MYKLILTVLAARHRLRPEDSDINGGVFYDDEYDLLYEQHRVGDSSDEDSSDDTEEFSIPYFVDSVIINNPIEQFNMFADEAWQLETHVDSKNRVKFLYGTRKAPPLHFKVDDFHLLLEDDENNSILIKLENVTLNRAVDKSLYFFLDLNGILEKSKKHLSHLSDDLNPTGCQISNPHSATAYETENHIERLMQSMSLNVKIAFTIYQSGTFTNHKYKCSRYKANKKPHNGYNIEKW